MNRNDVFGLDLGTTHGVSHVDLDGGRDAQALRFEGNIGRRTVGVHGINERFAGTHGVGIGSEESRAGWFTGTKAREPIGAAVFSLELARLPRATVDFG